MESPVPLSVASYVASQIATLQVLCFLSSSSLSHIDAALLALRNARMAPLNHLISQTRRRISLALVFFSTVRTSASKPEQEDGSTEKPEEDDSASESEEEEDTALIPLCWFKRINLKNAHRKIGMNAIRFISEY